MKGEAREEGGGREARRSASKARQASAQVVKPDVWGRRSCKESHGLNRSKSSMARRCGSSASRGMRGPWSCGIRHGVLVRTCWRNDVCRG